LGTTYSDSLSVGSKILVSDGVNNVYGSVVSIASNTSLQIDANASFSNTGCKVFLVNANPYGIISSTPASPVYVANVDVSSVSSSMKFIGEQSFCTTVADTVQIVRGGSTPDIRNSNNFNTFSQLTKLNGTRVGTFQADETVVQDSAVVYAVPSAKVYAAVGDDTLYVTNVQNVWQVGADDGIATGESSDAQFTVLAKYDGELVQGSGEVVYIENLAPIQRSTSQTETIKLILEF
jgi:hypothetical protein